MHAQHLKIEQLASGECRVIYMPGSSPRYIRLDQHYVRTETEHDAGYGRCVGSRKTCQKWIDKHVAAPENYTHSKVVRRAKRWRRLFKLIHWLR